MGKKENRGYITFEELLNFFYQSWIYGFKHLGWIIKRDKSISN
jgi:hypothetical protein